MVEAGANEVTEADMVKALKFAHDAIKEICVEIEKFAKKAGKAKREVNLVTIDPDIYERIDKEMGKEVASTLISKDKATRESALSDLERSIVKKYAEVAQTLTEAAKAFREDVEMGVYPGPEHEYDE